MFKLIKLETLGLIICTLSLLIAYIYFDLYKDLSACALCVLDRFLLFGISIIFIITIYNQKRIFHKTLCGISLFFCSIGLISTVRHIWLQNFKSNSEMDGFGCGGDFFYYLSNLPILEAIINIFDNPTPCNDIKWQLFGLSIPMYTFILFIILTIISLILIMEKKDGRI